MDVTEMKTQLVSTLKCIMPFSEPELEAIADCFKAKALGKNTALLENGQVCREFYYVCKGCIRTYFTDVQGNIKTRYIMAENHMGTAMASFINQNISLECIEAIEATEVLAITYADFQRLRIEMPNWNHFYLRILEMAYCYQNSHIEQLITLTPEQRYKMLLREHPDLCQRLSNRVLASLLDIREETLSRIKSR